LFVNFFNIHVTVASSPFSYTTVWIVCFMLYYCCMCCTVILLCCFIICIQCIIVVMGSQL